MLIKNLINSIENNTPNESSDFYNSYTEDGEDKNIFSTRYEKRKNQRSEGNQN